MSESFSDYSPDCSPHNRSLMPISEIYQIHKGNSGDWGIDGYKIPKKSQLLLIKESLIPKSKKHDMFYEASKRAKDPDPSKYSDTNEKTIKKYWSPSNGKFPKAAKKSYIDEAVKLSPRTPGPGTYYSLEKGKPEPVPKMKLGKMGKAEVISYLSTTEYYAEESPSPGQYFTKAEDREKAYSTRERKIQGFKYYPNKTTKKPEKQIVGPGYLEGLEKNILKEGKKKKIYAAFFYKANTPSVIQQRANNNKFVPGVGFYKNVDDAYTHHIVIPRERTTHISKSSFSRYSEMAAKSKSWVPGPGAYEILPPLRK